METPARGITPTPPSTTGVSNRTEGALNKVSSSAHVAVNSIAGAAEQIARKAQPAIDQVASMAHHAVERVAGAAVPTVDWLSEKGEGLKATQQKLVTDTRSYVSANPLKAVGIAVVAGFLLSRIML